MSTRIEQIRKRVDAATPGPWDYGCGSVTNWPDGTECPDVLMEWIANSGTPDCTQRHRDGLFMAEARTDVPYLLDRVERLEAALNAVKSWLMSDDNGDILPDSHAWREDFRQALKLTREALEPQS